MSIKTELIENNVKLQAILDTVNGLSDEVRLPTLSNPAGADHILSGYQALNGDGEVMEGIYEPMVTGTIKGTGQAYIRIPEIVGKPNVLIHSVSTGTIKTVLSCTCCDGRMESYNCAGGLTQTITYNSDTGTISGSGSNFGTFNSAHTYRYFAW